MPRGSPRKGPRKLSNRAWAQGAHAQPPQHLVPGSASLMGVCRLLGGGYRGSVYISEMRNPCCATPLPLPACRLLHGGGGAARDHGEPRVQVRAPLPGCVQPRKPRSEHIFDGCQEGCCQSYPAPVPFQWAPCAMCVLAGRCACCCLAASSPRPHTCAHLPTHAHTYTHTHMCTPTHPHRTMDDMIGRSDMLEMDSEVPKHNPKVGGGVCVCRWVGARVRAHCARAAAAMQSHAVAKWRLRAQQLLHSHRWRASTCPSCSSPPPPCGPVPRSAA